MKILFVCTGNTCRSPMAEALLKSKAPGAEVQSAGLSALPNQAPADYAADVLNRAGMTPHNKSKLVSGMLLQWADLVLTMTTQHKQSLILKYPEFQTKYFTLKEYASSDDKEIWDELKQRYAAYEEKRSQFVQISQHQMASPGLSEALSARMQEDWQRIQQLKNRLIDYDIPDPFGGSLADYERTLEELDRYISALADKLHTE